jgi:hypothetical protein
MPSLESSRTVVLYMKQGCHLCDIARGWIEDCAADPDGYAPLTLDEIDIRRTPALFAEYGLRIPVIVIDGAVVAEGRMNDAAQAAIVHALIKR